MSDSRTQAGDDYNTIPTSKKGLMIVYKECNKNHAASLGAHSTDGCGEFMPSSSKDEALLCLACGCHRNFHRKEVDKSGTRNTYLPDCQLCCNTCNGLKSKEQECHQAKGALKTRHGPAANLSENDGEQIKVEGMIESKKRYRTRFTNEQKEKLLGFAEKTNWKIKRVDEGLVNQFCQDVGIKRKVLKIWMHNNKHLFVKKFTNSTLIHDQEVIDSSNKLRE